MYDACFLFRHLAMEIAQYPFLFLDVILKFWQLSLAYI